jgi:hypothetical protein
MPGFNINGNGGYSNQGPSNTVEVRRQHRWVFETVGRGTGQFSQAELLLLKSASRPSFKLQEAEMHHNQEVVKFAGKQSWEPVSMTWYDAEQDPDCSRGIYHWIETVVNMQSIAVAHPRFYKTIASLAMIDGTGQSNEVWTMYGTWPTSCNWGTLDYSASELMTLEVSMVYDRAVRARLDGSCAQSPAPQPITPNCPTF